MGKHPNLVIDAEFKALLIPLAPDERSMLEESLLAHGCLHPLTAWRENGRLLITDGHNRHQICEQHGVEYGVKEMEFESREHVKIWIRKNQLGRRNLPDDAKAMLGAQLYKDISTLEKRERARKAGKAGGRGRPKDSLSTTAVEKLSNKKDNLAVIAKQSKVSQRRVRAALTFEKQAIEQLGKVAAEKVCDEIGRGNLTIARARQEIKQQKKRALAEKINREPPAPPTGPFRVLAADPPWRYDSRADDPTHRSRNPYPDKSVDEIKALPVAEYAHADSILWLWAPNAFLREAFEVLDAWGFEYKTTLTWAKDRMGTGDYLRGQTEQCLMAIRGNPIRTPLTNQTTLLHGPLREHSRKPDSFYALVESLCPGNKAELFAREQREGWTPIMSPELGKFAAERMSMN